MLFTPDQIESIAPKPAAFRAGSKLAKQEKWETYGHSSRQLWGVIKGSGKTPYFIQVDLEQVAYKCSCPSRQFPCKHGLALMLLFSSIPTLETSEEPEWAVDWINKRRKKTEPKEEGEVTPEEIVKRNQAKIKRQEDRLVLVNAGVTELKLWLSDLVRTGLLELPNKPPSYFKTMAARMVDAKAPGLAGWVRSLGKIQFASIDDWYDEALAVIAKLNLLLRTWENLDNLPKDWQHTIKNLVGWSQSTKELLQNTEALAIKDDWIVLGQEKETIDDLVILRSWLWASASSKSCLVLNFGTPFSPLENNLMVGRIMQAEVAYFPGHAPQRGVVRVTNEHYESLPGSIDFHTDFSSLIAALREKEAVNPWLTNEVFLVEHVRLISEHKRWYLIDSQNQLISVADAFNEQSNMRWILKTSNDVVNIALVMKGQTALPLGIFTDEHYRAL